MASAVRAHRISVSPCEGVELPKVERTEMRFLTRPGWSRWPKPWTLASHRRCCSVALPRGELVNCSACALPGWTCCTAASRWPRSSPKLVARLYSGRPRPEPGAGCAYPPLVAEALVDGYRPPRSWRLPVMLGLLEPALVYLGDTSGLSRTSGVDASILSGLEPALVVVLAAILLGEIVTLAVVLALGGLEVLAGRRAEPLGQHR
jgi:hypothetical protein